MKVFREGWHWLDNRRLENAVSADSDRIEWARVLPFVALHLACFGVLLVGVSATAVWIAIASYLLRMFAITAFYHRYFAHKSFKTHRSLQFLFALLGTTATQRGPLWWSAHHRHHHRVADTEQDPHTPQKGFWYSHCGWFLGGRHFQAPDHLIRDFSRFPELVWLDRFDIVPPILYALSLWGIGELLRVWAPQLNTNGWQVLIWGYFISTVVLIHATLAINSLSHRFGHRRYETDDQSRNSFWLALLTLGEGWHNNHHHFSGSARQGFFWWEVDVSFYLLKLMQWSGLVWDLRSVPDQKKWAHRTPAGGAAVDRNRRGGGDQ